MRRFILAAFLIVLGSAAFAQTESKLTWYTEFAKANEVSTASQKPIFAFFTGSDWCGWCKKLQQDVFAKEEFITWAEKNVVLLELDFPRNKQLPEQLVQQNYSLAQFFKVQGYPAIWMFFAAKDAKGEKVMINALGQLGYPGGAEKGAEQVKFLENANSILAKK
jgi:thioredoxin-related protein